MSTYDAATVRALYRRRRVDWPGLWHRVLLSLAAVAGYTVRYASYVPGVAAPVCLVVAASLLAGSWAGWAVAGTMLLLADRRMG